MRLTNKTILKCLIPSKSGAVSLTLMQFPVKVLHGFIVQKTVSMYASGDDIFVVHLSAKFSSPAGQDHGGDN